MRLSALRLLICPLFLLASPASVEGGQVCEPSHVATIGGRSAGLTVDGDIAYVANTVAGLHMYNISDPTSPSLLGIAQTIDWTVGVAVNDGMAYVAALEGGLQIFDVTTPSAPQKITTFETPGTRVTSVVLEGDVCYITVRDIGLQILDVSSPSEPVLLGTAEITDGYPHRLVVDEDLAFIAAEDAGLQIVDVSNSAAPAVTGSYQTSTSAKGVAVDGDTAYIIGADRLHIINIANAAIPSFTASVATNGQTRGVAAAGGLAYVSTVQNGLRIFDPSGPFGAVEVGRVEVEGVFLGGVDLVVRDGKAYALDAVSGMHVFDVTTPAAPLLSGSFEAIHDPQGVAVDGATLAVVDFDLGLKLMDVSDPHSPQPLGRFFFDGADGGVEIEGDVVFAGDNEMVEILDISDRMNPVRLSTLPITGATDMEVVGKLLYVVSQNDTDLSIIDVSNPSSPEVLGELSVAGRSYDLAVVGDLAYIANGNRQLQIVDIADPTAPALLTDDSSARGHYKPEPFARGVDVRGDYAYVAASAVGMQVYYVADPTNPVLLLWEGSEGGARDVEIIGSRAFVQGGSDLVVYDLSNAHSPQPVGYGDTESSGAARSLAVGADVVYLARDYGGLAVFEIETCIPVGPADLSGDGAVDATDLAIMIAAWGSSSPSVDLNFDGVVDTTDLAILLAAWT